jgi:hypothetical protein
MLRDPSAGQPTVAGPSNRSGKQVAGVVETRFMIIAIAASRLDGRAIDL